MKKESGSEKISPDCPSRAADQPVAVMKLPAAPDKSRESIERMLELDRCRGGGGPSAVLGHLVTFDVPQSLENRTIEVLETGMSPDRRALDRTFEVCGGGHDVEPFLGAIQDFVVGGIWVKPIGRSTARPGVA